MIEMQLSITLKYSIMNVLIIKERIYLNARERYNIIQKNNKDDEDDKTICQIRIVFSFFHFFVLEIISLLNSEFDRNITFLCCFF